MFSHHLTFFINSLAHIVGRQPYTDENTARDNALVALVTLAIRSGLLVLGLSLRVPQTTVFATWIALSGGP